MFLHLSFTNGSNPFIMYGKGNITKEDCLKELEVWKQNYNVLDITEEHGGIFAVLSERKRYGAYSKSIKRL